MDKTNINCTNSSFITLTGDTDKDCGEVDRAKKTLDRIYEIHDNVNKFWDKNEDLKNIKDFISKSKKIIRVSSDVHGDINCLNFNLNNIVTLKKDNFLVIDPTNGQKIFQGSIDEIKNDLTTGDNSTIRQVLKNNNKILEKQKKDYENYVLGKLTENMRLKIEDLAKSEDEEYKNNIAQQCIFDPKTKILSCKYEFTHFVENGTDKNNPKKKLFEEKRENVTIKIDFNEVHKILKLEDSDTALRKYCLSCFKFANGKRFQEKQSPYKLDDDLDLGYLCSLEENSELVNFSLCCLSAFTEANGYKEKYKINAKQYDDHNDIVLLHDFDIKKGFDFKKEINIITGDHIDRGPHSTEVLCMESQVKEKLQNKLKEEKQENIENKINENEADNDKKTLEDNDNLVLTIGDHETGFHGSRDNKNESAANLLAKKMIVDRKFVPAYLHELEDGRIISHSHVMFLIPHVFQVFRQIDELNKLLELEKDIDNNDFFEKYKNNEFVQILDSYRETDERGKIILKSLIDTYRKVLEQNKYKNLFNRIFSTDNQKKVRDIINGHKGRFYKNWDDCVNSGYDFYKKVEEEFKLSTKDFFMLRNFAMDVFSRPVASDTDTKNKLSKIDNFNSDSFSTCFADYFSDMNKSWNAVQQLDNCLKSLRMIKFWFTEYGSNIYWERKLNHDKYLEDDWSIAEEKNGNKLIFPDVIQIIGHDKNSEHKVQLYDNSIINIDTASSIGYSEADILDIDNSERSCFLNEIIYDPEKPENAYQVKYLIKDVLKDPEQYMGVEKIKLGFRSKKDLETAIQPENKEEINEIKIENKDKNKENELKIQEDEKKINNEKENESENKSDNIKTNENEIIKTNEDKIIKTDEIKNESDIVINEKEDKKKENNTGGTYLMKLLLIIIGLLLIGGGIGLFFTATVLALKCIAIGLGILGAVGFGIGFFYNKIGDYYSKKPESCCFRFWTYTIFESKEQTQETNINSEKEKDNFINEDENVP